MNVKSTEKSNKSVCECECTWMTRSIRFVREQRGKGRVPPEETSLDVNILAGLVQLSESRGGKLNFASTNQRRHLHGNYYPSLADLEITDLAGRWMIGESLYYPYTHLRHQFASGFLVCCFTPNMILLY